MLATVGVTLSPIEDRAQRYRPVLVAYAGGSVVVRHSGIFEERLKSLRID